MGRRRNFKDYHFWARGYSVPTAGIDKRTTREYIRHQEKNDLADGGFATPAICGGRI
jgi:putative transposase